MMLHVLRACMSEETKLFGTQDSHDDSDDRGSDAGSCMCMDVDDCASDGSVDLSDAELQRVSVSGIGDCVELLADNEPNSASDIEDCMEFDILDDDFDLGATILT